MKKTTIYGQLDGMGQKLKKTSAKWGNNSYETILPEPDFSSLAFLPQRIVCYINNGTTGAHKTQQQYIIT